jgi:hypothetical protein
MSTKPFRNHPCRELPHISLVFREMWDSTNLNLLPAHRGAET